MDLLLAISSTLVLVMLRWLVFCLTSHTHYLVCVHSISVKSRDFLGCDAIYHLLRVLIIKPIVMSFWVLVMISSCRSCVCDSHVGGTVSSCSWLLAHVVEDYLRRVFACARLLVEHDILLLVTCSSLPFYRWSLRRTDNPIAWCIN